MNLTELKVIWREHGYRPVKKLGQNFLIDNNVRDNILGALPISRDDTVLEIGPGFGAMTSGMAERCGKLYAIEKDRKICSMAGPFYEGQPNIEFICGDILEADICSFSGKGGKIVVFGSLPYYITTPIMEKLIGARHCIKGIYIVVQEEFAHRIISHPGTKDFGSISCFVQFYTRARKLFRIKKNSFYPKPQVDSSFLALDVLEEPSVSVKDKDLMFRIIRKSFSERRKKVINPLSHGGFLGMDRGGWEDVLRSCGIDLSRRAETLSLEDFARISDRAGQSAVY